MQGRGDWGITKGHSDLLKQQVKSLGVIFLPSMQHQNSPPFSPSSHYCHSCGLQPRHLRLQPSFVWTPSTILPSTTTPTKLSRWLLHKICIYSAHHCYPAAAAMTPHHLQYQSEDSIASLQGHAQPPQSPLLSVRESKPKMFSINNGIFPLNRGSSEALFILCHLWLTQNFHVINFHLMRGIHGNQMSHLWLEPSGFVLFLFFASVTWVREVQRSRWSIVTTTTGK